MAITAYTGPLVAFGQASGSDNNPDAPAPQMFADGVGLLDTRDPFTYQPGAAANHTFYGYLGGQVVLVDQAPSLIAVDNIAASNTIVSGTALTLVSTSGAGITVGASVVNALTGVTATGLLAIDTAMAPLFTSAQGAGMGLWNPAKAISRAISLTSSDNLSGLTFTIRGYDVYGYPLTVTRAGPNNTTVNTTKTFKYVTSITPSASNAGHVTVGTADIFGIGLITDAWAYVTVYWDNALITAATGFVAAVGTTASATTGDVRGTYATQSASDGTKRLQLFWRPRAADLTHNGYWGVAQF